MSSEVTNQTRREMEKDEEKTGEYVRFVNERERERSVQGEASRGMAEDKREPGSDAPRDSSASIPVVDLRVLAPSDGSNQGEMAKLREAVGSWGLFQLTGHGITTSFLDEVRRIGRQFFELPMDEKQRYSSKGEGFAEGYGKDRIYGEVSRTDRLLLWVEPQDTRKLEFWPDHPSSFRETVHEYSTRVKTVVQLILQALAKSLDLEETHFISQSGRERMGTVCRFCHYPPCSRPDLFLGQQIHSDNSVLSVILQGDVEGLELLKDDVWVKVPINPDVLIVLMGDLMEIMSNGVFKSPVHRVVSHSEVERTSTVLFYAGDPEKEIGPPEKLLKEGKPRLYRDVKVQDYLDAHLKSLSEGKRSVDWAKV